MALENTFQAKLIKDLRDTFPDVIILKNDPNYLQGFPDILVLYGNTWAALETKKSAHAKRQPNQEYYVGILDDMAYATFVYPENEEQVLDELQQTFRLRRSTRLSRR